MNNENQVNIYYYAGITMAFQHFDNDGSGAITAVELKEIMMKSVGKETTLDEAQSLIEKYDKDGERITILRLH